MASQRRVIDQLVAAGVDLYKELELTPSATADEIKRAYRKLALRWHPDRVPESEKTTAEARFKRINQAHEILSDPELRHYYDSAVASRSSWGRWFTGGETAGTGRAAEEAAAAESAFASYSMDQAMDHFAEVFRSVLEQYKQLYETAAASSGDGEAPEQSPFWTAIGAVAGAFLGAWLGESKEDKIAFATAGAAIGGGAGYLLMDREGAVLRKWWNGLSAELKRKLLNELAASIAVSGEALTALKQMHSAVLGSL